MRHFLVRFNRRRRLRVNPATDQSADILVAPGPLALKARRQRFAVHAGLLWSEQVQAVARQVPGGWTVGEGPEADVDLTAPSSVALGTPATKNWALRLVLSVCSGVTYF